MGPALQPFLYVMISHRVMCFDGWFARPSGPYALRWISLGYLGVMTSQWAASFCRPYAQSFMRRRAHATPTKVSLRLFSHEVKDKEMSIWPRVMCFDKFRAQRSGISLFRIGGYWMGRNGRVSVYFFSSALFWVVDYDNFIVSNLSPLCYLLLS